MCGRLRRFIFGYTTAVDDRRYPHPGFVEREGVRYLGQSVLFVTRPRLDELRPVLHGLGVDHEVWTATVGNRVPC